MTTRTRSAKKAPPTQPTSSLSVSLKTTKKRRLEDSDEEVSIESDRSHNKENDRPATQNRILSKTMSARDLKSQKTTDGDEPKQHKETHNITSTNTVKSKNIPTNATHNVPTNLESQKYKELKERYDNLKSLRTTEVEQIYNDFRKHATEREEASKKLIGELRREKERLDRDIKDRETDTQKHIKEYHNLQLQLQQLQRKNDELQNQNERLLQQQRLDHQQEQRRMMQNDDRTSSISFYEELTSIKILSHDEEENNYECICHVNNIPLQFSLTIRDKDVEYCPKQWAEEGKVQLAKYIKEEITFDKSVLPIFLSKFLSQLHLAYDDANPALK